MKKFLAVVFLFFIMSPAYSVVPDAAIIQVHDMQMINQQRFRYEELNDYNDVQTEKERYKKRTEPEQPFVQKIINKDSKKSKFVDDNGQIKIEYDKN